MTDVLLFQSDDGGNVRFENGQAVPADGLETTVYLSLFGGNERDSGGTDGEELQWWGNLIEEEDDRKYRSETQYLLRSIPAITGNLVRIQDAVERDLAWLSVIASEVSVSVTMPGVNSVRIEINVTIDDREFNYVFSEAWRQAS